MKRIINRSLSVICVVGLLCVIASCEDQLTQSPISEIGSNGFYNNIEDFDKAVTGTYNLLRSYPERQYDLAEVRSDNINAEGTAGVRDYNAVNNYLRTLTTTGIINDAWGANFNGVMRANAVLEQLNAEAVPDESLRNRFEGEVKFLRALYYFNLVRWFGKVPLITGAVSPEEAREVPRSPVADVYDVIIEDLNFAVNNLPESYSADNVGRVTSHAARGILARVYLTRSGPQLHPDGPALGTDEYAEALQLLNEIINSGQFGLLDNYQDIFAYDNENNAEIVFDVQFESGGQGLGGVYVAGYYSEQYARAVDIPFAGGTPPDGPKSPSEDLLQSYEDGDPRVEFSVQDGYTDESGDFIPEQFIKKFLDLNNLGVDRFDFGLNFPVIRYADILLMKAECLLMTGGSQSEVDAIVNDIRSRVGLDNVSNVSYEQLMEVRRKEFIGEGLRWHDLVRSGLVIEVINDWIIAVGSNQIADNITENDILYPVPQSQLDVKQGLYEQNPGYD